MRGSLERNAPTVRAFGPLFTQLPGLSQWRCTDGGQMEDILEGATLILIAAGVIATAFYAGKIYELLKKDN
jgi:hypothetical protein